MKDVPKIKTELKLAPKTDDYFVNNWSRLNYGIMVFIRLGG